LSECVRTSVSDKYKSRHKANSVGVFGERVKSKVFRQFRVVLGVVGFPLDRL